MIKPGAKVPDLHAASTAGAITLGQFRGAPLVVYFYPKDSTPGCTREAQDFRDLAAAFRKHKAVVLGVSRDSLKSHENFRNKQALSFALVSDPDETWCKAFDVIHEKVLYGKHYLGVVRSTFLIGADGRVQREWRGVKVPGHAAEVLAALAESA
jgi:thioredoxin-dependent peroxiredoxin